MSSRNVVIVGMIVGLMVVCACVLVVVGAAGALFYLRAGPAADATSSTPSNPASVSAEMDAIEQEVKAMRGLQPATPVERKFLTVEQVKQRMIDDFNEDTTPEEWADDTRVLAAFGLVEPEIDLYNLLLRLYSEGVAGFYDPDTKELVVVSEEGGLNAYEQVTFAHEYNHALQDQNYDLRDGMGFGEEGWDADPQRAAAAQALIEGDSTLLDEQYKDTLSRAELREYDAALNDIDVSIYRELPDFLLRDFAFPYIQGVDFVRRYYRKGGWARVDEVWKDPPVSTEHILHPERYEAGDLPIVVERPALTDTLGTGWRQIDSSVNGEWYTYLILAYGVDPDARLSESEAADAAEGWGGDSYVAFYNDPTGEIVLAQHWVWDTQKDADEFAEAFRAYGDLRFGPAESIGAHTCWRAERGPQCFYVNGLHSLWIGAPDEATVEAVLSLYPDLR